MSNKIPVWCSEAKGLIPKSAMAAGIFGALITAKHKGSAKRQNTITKRIMKRHVLTEKKTP